MVDSNPGTNWSAVIGRSLALQTLYLVGLDDAKVKLAEKGQFLLDLGLQRADAAALLGTSDDSLRVTLANAKKKVANVDNK